MASTITVGSQISKGKNFCEFHELFGHHKKIIYNNNSIHHELPRVMLCNLPTANIKLKFVDTKVF